MHRIVDANAMKIVLAPNAFKDCLDAAAVCRAMEAGARVAAPAAEIVSVPLADGGDGTMELLVNQLQGALIHVEAHDALRRSIQTSYGLVDNGTTAVIEMASSCGLWRLQKHERDAMQTSTWGFGEVIRNALDRGVQKLLLCIGGSATNDGGAGMASALGYRFFRIDGHEMQPVGGNLRDIHRIDTSQVHPLLKQVRVIVACDVDNPLLGPRGATTVFGPQKGANAQTIPVLEAGLANLSQLWRSQMAMDVATVPGAGAAGGLGAGLMSFCGGKLTPGFDLVAEAMRLGQHLTGADLVITGEGQLDGSSAGGKVPVGVGRYAQRYGVPCVALAGSVGSAPTKVANTTGVSALQALHQGGINAVFSITPGPVSLQMSMDQAAVFIATTTEQIVRLVTVPSRAPARAKL